MIDYFISVGAGWQQVRSMELLKKKGIKILCLDQNPHATGMRIADDFIIVNIKDTHATLLALDEYKKSKQVHFIGVASFLSDAGQLTAASIAQQYRLKGLDPKVALISVRKDLQREVCMNAGIRMATGRILSNVDEKLDFSFPVVVKPADSAGSRGVFFCDGFAELKLNFIQALNSSVSKTVMVEEFVRGTEYSVETLWIDGEMYPAAISKRILDGMSARIISSVKLPDELEYKVLNTVRSYHEAIGYKNGIGHTELFVTPDGDVVFGESACRGGGFGTSEYLAKVASGCDINGIYASWLIGEDLSQLRKPILNHSFCALYFVPARTGTFRGLEIDKVLSQEWLEICPLVEEGIRTLADGSDNSRVAMAIIQASSAEALQERLELVQNYLKAKYESN